MYSGSVKNGLYDGKGKLIIADGSTYDGTWKNGKKNGKFNIVLAGSGTKLSITYQDDEDVIEIAKRKREEAEEKRRIAQEEADSRRAENSRRSSKKSDCEDFIDLCRATTGASYSVCKYQMKRETNFCD